MRGNWLLLGWACVEIVSLWLSIRGNWFLVGWAYAEIGIFISGFYWYWTMFSPCHPFPCPLSNILSPVSSICSLSHPLFPVSRLCSLFPVHCSLSHVAVPCLTSSVPCLTFMFFVSCPLSLWSMSHFFVPCLPSSVSCLTSLFLVSRPLFPV